MIETPPLVDQYCQGVLRAELGLATFEAQLAPSAGPPASGTTFFDTQTGFAVRRWCPPLLGLEPHCAPARYLARRRELGAAESARRLLRGCGVGARLVDSGMPGDLTGPKELALAGEAEAFELVRPERLAEQAADTSGTVADFLANLAGAVHHAAAGAVAFTCGAAAGARPAAESDARDWGAALEAAPEPPGPGEVRGAAGRWLAARAEGGALRDPVLLRHLAWSAVSAGLPLQLHTGGEPGEPERLTGFLRATEGLGARLVLIGGYPHHRQAARLAAAFPHVHADLGAALGPTGARAAAVLAECLETAPFGKLMFSGGGRQLPELHAVGALVFREALGRVLGGWVADGSWSWRDAERVAAMVAAGNARRVYRLDERG
ncbi:amidohydrolase [Streptomyces sp. NBC_01244]|uniref:amidohydrolase n=1 Tax=Streptomyces sp. NBC_01244 TaxID=2903797 RepID=UPI002E12C76F|nr:amidohydrolase [Streptomyces sp. NBC_01244]